jgi:hypothetical protein
MNSAVCRIAATGIMLASPAITSVGTWAEHPADEPGEHMTA